MHKVCNRSHSRPLQSVRYQTSMSPPCFCADKSRTLPQKRFQAQAVWKIKDHPPICCSKPQLLPLASQLLLPSFIDNHPCWLLLQENDDSSQVLFGSWKSVNQPMEKCKINQPFEFSALLMNSCFLTPRESRLFQFCSSVLVRFLVFLMSQRWYCIARYRNNVLLCNFQGKHVSI